MIELFNLCRHILLIIAIIKLKRYRNFNDVKKPENVYGAQIYDAQ